ncbi:MAG: SRPBCC family protein [Cyclobacteriaceae bacterium]
MTPTSNNYAEAAMLIRKHPNEVFEAFIDPEITTKFWFTKSSGRLEVDQPVDWTWEMYDHTFQVTAKEIIHGKKILIQWGDDPESQVEWEFQSLEEGTFVTIHVTGFKGSNEELISQIRDATGGFTWVLAGLKAYLEHNNQLNLVADRYPKGLD